MALSPPIHIWIRETVDWSDAEAAMAELRAPLRRKAEIWNRHFNLPYHRFRRRIAEIARLNHSRVEGASVSEWDQIPDGALVLPVDDDDWFAPEAAAAVREAWDPAAAGCLWNSAWLEVPIDLGHLLHLAKLRVVPGASQRWICTTNNYALVKRPGVRWLLYRHTYASDWVAGGGIDRMLRIDRNLSLQNRTVASQTSMGLWRDRVSRARLMLKYRAYRGLYERAELAGVEWARPYAEMMGELMAELEPLPRG